MNSESPTTPMDIPGTPIDNIEPPSTGTQLGKRRRKKSIVWNHFTIETISADCSRACCNQCKKSFAYINGAKMAGTSHLKRHISLGICPVSRESQQLIPGTNSPIDPPKRRYRRSSPSSRNVVIDQENCNQELAKMIILHDYPLNMVEHHSFIGFVRTIQPQFKMVSFNTIEEYCVKIYLREKENISNFLAGTHGRVCLSLDMWGSDQTHGYVSVIGSFIDGDWKLHRRILSVIMVPYPDSDDAINQAVFTCLSYWGLENRLFTLTVDKSNCNENNIENLRSFLSIKNPSMLKGQFLVGNCYARVLTRLAQDSLATMSETVNKVRESVKYVKTSEEHEEKFMELKQQLQVPTTKTLLVDDLAKWDTTYHMLTAACELKQVFACLDATDQEYKNTPSMEEWKQIEILVKYLKLFYDSAHHLTTSLYPTPSCFFFLKAWDILTHLASSEKDPFIRPLQEKFDKYWKDCCLVLAMCVVMDPRFKLTIVEFKFSNIYGDDSGTWVNLVKDSLHELFLEYMVSSLPPPSPSTSYMMEEINGNGDENIFGTENHHQQQDQEYSLIATIDDFSDFDVHISEDIIETENHHQQVDDSLLSTDNDFPVLDVYYNSQLTPTNPTTTNDHSKSIDGLADFDAYVARNSTHNPSNLELDQYLDEPLVPRLPDFDLLCWWKLNKIKYPILSRMASDILSIPLSTVGPDSVFDTVGKKMSSYQSSLRPGTLEALICAKEWLQYSSS